MERETINLYLVINLKFASNVIKDMYALRGKIEFQIAKILMFKAEKHGRLAIFTNTRIL